MLILNTSVSLKNNCPKSFLYKMLILIFSYVMYSKTRTKENNSNLFSSETCIRMQVSEGALLLGDFKKIMTKIIWKLFCYYLFKKKLCCR